MDTITPEGPVSTGDSVMGNETSKIDIKHDLGDVEKPGQFHRVLVEPDYSVIDSTTPTKETVSNNFETTPKTHPSSAPDPISNNINHKDTAKVIEVDTPETNDHGAVDEQKIQVLAKEIVEQVVQNVIANGSAGPNLVNGDALSDNSGQITDLNANSQTQNNPVEKNAIVLETIEGGDIAVVNGNGTESVKAEKEVNSNKETAQVEAAIDTSQTKIETVADKELVAKKAKGKNKQNSGKAKKKEKKLQEQELVESDKQTEVDEKKPGKGKGFMKMFKFSKRKPLTVSGPADTEVAEATDENHCNDNSVDNKPLSENEVPKETTQVENVALVNKTSEENKENGMIPVSEQTPTLDEGARNVKTKEEESHSDLTNTETNESLDSGIVVEKVQEIQTDKLDTELEHKIESTQIIAVNTDLKADVNATDSLEIKAKEPESAIQVSSINVVNENGDVKEFNERGIDVEDLTHTINKDINTISSTQSVEEEKKNAIKDSEPENGNPGVKKLDEQSPETQEQNKATNVKIKRKSWSFQIGSSKKKADAQNTEDHKDSSKHGGGGKKPKWRLGKFSFRKSTSDVSLSTPDLTNSGIPEETTGDSETTIEKKEDKKKNILKKIKSKKEKKKDAQSKEVEPFERRSNSLFDIILGDNRRGSRRSIVEEELSYTETDAFDGVSLSDLSAEEDVQVSKNPAGAESKPTNKSNGLAAKAKGLFKSDKKKSPTTAAAPVDTRKVSERIKMLDNSEYAQIQDEDADVKIEAGVDLDVEKTEELNVKESGNDTGTVETVANFKEDPGGVYAQIVKPEGEDKTEAGEQSTEQSKETVEITKNVSEEVELDEKATEISDADSKDGQADALKENCVKELGDKESDTDGHSNPLYGDVGFTVQVLKSADDVLKAGHEDSDSDAYVQLEELVTEHKPNNIAQQEAVPKQPEVITDDVKTITDQNKDTENNEVTIEAVNNEKKAESSETVEELIQVLKSDSCESAQQSVNNTKPEVLIMKEVGVQAPDIHMPLDIEKDFSFPSSSLEKVSIGIQVANGSMTLDHAENNSPGGKKTSTGSNSISSAYF